MITSVVIRHLLQWYKNRRKIAKNCLCIKGLGSLSRYVKDEARNLGVVFVFDLEKVIHTFVTSRLDYCNILNSRISKESIHKLQLLQNTPARLLTCSWRFEHITLILANLHWLPVTLRIDCKILLLFLKPYTTRHHLIVLIFWLLMHLTVVWDPIARTFWLFLNLDLWLKVIGPSLFGHLNLEISC